jgi:hypothetical protein
MFGAFAPGLQIQMRTSALLSTDKNASRFPSGDHTGLKKPMYDGLLALSVRSACDFTSNSAISFVGTLESSVRSGRVSSVAA